MNQKNKIKLIANYLPQFHCIPENDRWWGKGFTDWVAVKNSIPLYKNHKQPRVPENNNYYNLLNENVLRWQCKIAKENNIYAFGMYHYWFSSNMKLLEKPAEIFLKSNIDFKIMFIWDNSSWKRTWNNETFANDWTTLYGNNNKYREKNVDTDGFLAKIEYGNKEDWEVHFQYLLRFFKDDRYVKINNKPVFAIFNQDNNSGILDEMFNYWNIRAIEEGLDGLLFIGKVNRHKVHLESISYEYLYEPIHSAWTTDNVLKKIFNKIAPKIEHLFGLPDIFYYDRVWNNIITNARENRSQEVFYGAFLGYDDTPRRGINGKVIEGQTKEKFKKYFNQLVDISLKQGKSYIFFTAWNEWGEGAYLEPDKDNGIDYLTIIREIVNKYTKET